ncbi:MAG: DUF4136 domain-containing protein [Phycisphaeraceae bacterium]
MSLILAACSAAPNTRTAHDPTADFANYKTFAFDPLRSSILIVEPQRTNEVLARISQAIESNLRQQGLEPAGLAAADLLVSVQIGARETFEQTNWVTADTTFGTLDVPLKKTPYREGAIAINMLDRGRGAIVWQGVAQGRFDNPDTATRLIEKTIRQLLKDFPRGTR